MYNYGTSLYLTITSLLLLWKITNGMDNLRVAYQWKMIDYDFPSDEYKNNLIKEGDFIPENNLPLGLEVYGDRLFITVPRWKDGVAASLTYIKLSGNIHYIKVNKTHL